MEFRSFKKEGSHAGTYGWIALGAYVAAFDLLSPETLSSAVDRALEHKTMRYLAIGGTALVGAHLLNFIKPEYDPLIITADLVKSYFDER